MELTFFNPLILHFTGIKPWKIRLNSRCNQWWEYVKKLLIIMKFVKNIKNHFIKKRKEKTINLTKIKLKIYHNFNDLLISFIFSFF